MEDVITEINIETDDIRYKIANFLEQNGYEELISDEDRLKMELEALRVYLLDKVFIYIKALGLNNESSLFDIMAALDKNQVENRMDGLSQILHYIIELISSYTHFRIIWSIEDHLKLDDFYVKTQGMKVDEFVTGCDVSFDGAFKLLYKILVGEIKYERNEKITLKNV